MRLFGYVQYLLQASDSLTSHFLLLMCYLLQPPLVIVVFLGPSVHVILFIFQINYATLHIIVSIGLLFSWIWCWFIISNNTAWTNQDTPICHMFQCIRSLKCCLIWYKRCYILCCLQYNFHHSCRSAEATTSGKWNGTFVYTSLFNVSFLIYLSVHFNLYQLTFQC